MAIWYTDNLIGSDSTGSGTIVLPYKTVNKAMTVGTNGDEIRVAGSGFTSLPGTCSQTSRTGTSWNTSQSLVGLLVPGDIITYNDPNFGDQKFFYKIFSVSATGFVTDGATNFDENINVTISKVTTLYYNTSTANITFENITITSKSQFNIRGGWVNSFTEQTGWTAMSYHSTSSATAQSGIGFTAVSEAGMYFDRFMISHLSTGFAGSIYTWAPGTLAFVYASSATSLGANPIGSATYPNKDVYMSNTRFGTFNSPQSAADGSPALKYNNCWFMRVAVVSNATICVVEIADLYTKGYSIGAVSTFSVAPAGQCKVNNLTVSSFGTVGSTEYVSLGESGTSPTNLIITNSITRVGLNTSNLIYAYANTANVQTTQIILPAQNIETLPGSTTESGWTGMNTNVSVAPVGGLYRTSTYVKDVEGFKNILGNGQVIFADPTQYSTGTNSLRISKGRGPGVNPVSLTPIEHLFITTSTSKTVTIRCKSSVAGNVTFGIIPNAKTSNMQATTTQELAAEVKAITTDWTDVTYTGLNATNAALLVNSFFVLGVNAITMPGKYIWIDSVTVA